MYTTEAVHRKGMIVLIAEDLRPKSGFLVENTLLSPEIVSEDILNTQFNDCVGYLHGTGFPYLLAESMKDGRVALIPMQHVEERPNAPLFWDIKAGIWSWTQI